MDVWLALLAGVLAIALQPAACQSVSPTAGTLTGGELCHHPVYALGAATVAIYVTWLLLALGSYAIDTAAAWWTGRRGTAVLVALDGRQYGPLWFSGSAAAWHRWSHPPPRRFARLSLSPLTRT